MRPRGRAARQLSRRPDRPRRRGHPSGRSRRCRENGRGRPDQRRREVHPVVVEPSPTPRESYRLVAHRIAALEPRVAGGTLVLALQRRAQEGVREHTRHAGGREQAKPRGAKAAVNPAISAAPATPPSVPRAVIPPEVPRVTLTPEVMRRGGKGE